MTANVLVVGAPRSGTSLVTQYLHECGWDIGDRCRKEIQQNAHDPHRWEDPFFVKANNMAFMNNEGHPLMPPDHVWAEYSQEGIEELLSDKETPWALKDPSLSITLPMWWKMLPGDFRVICPVRHPAESIRSLAKLSAFPLSRYPKVWYRYMSNVLAMSEYLCPITFVSFPNLIGIEEFVQAQGKEPVDKGQLIKPMLVHEQQEQMDPQFDYLVRLWEALVRRIQTKRE